MNSRNIALLAILISSILGSVVAGVTKRGLEEIPPYTFTFLRFFISALCILPFFIYLKGHKVSKMRELVPISLFATINVLFFIIGVKYTTANVGSVIYAAVPLLSAGILFILFKQRLSKRKELGLLIGFLGVLLITLLPIFEKGNPFAGNLLGNVFLTVAIIAWSFYTVYSKKLQEKYSPFLITANFIFVSTVATLPLALLDVQTDFGWWHHVGAWGIFGVLYVAIVITVLNYMLYQYAIRHGGAILAGMMFYITPIFGFVANYFIVGELLTTGFIFGSLLALIGTYLVVRK
jgi:drug/metabolite transporter (DMT)-like permease